MNTPLVHLAKRHRPSGLNSIFLSEKLPFSEYLSLTRAMLITARTKLGSADLAKSISGNMPFVLEPSCENGNQKRFKRGILLTHGLTDSPYFMRPLANFFQAQGFLVMTTLLPGHGTQPGDLLNVSWQEWAKAVAYGTECLAREVDEVYLGGLSTGATLSIYQSWQDPRVRALFLFSPALKIGRNANFAFLHKFYSWLRPRAKWVSIKPDIDCYKYESFAKNGAVQVLAMMHRVQALQRKRALQIPVFSVASADDVTVQTSATLDFMATLPHRVCQTLLYSTTQPVLPKNFLSHRFEWKNSVFPEQRILGSAHTAIVLPPDDTHYGRQGCYLNCTHYYPDQMEKYAACSDIHQQIAQGEITPENLHKGTMRRLMYNPDYAGMTRSLQLFIDRLSDPATDAKPCC
jgi:esterase/lipase